MSLTIRGMDDKTILTDTVPLLTKNNVSKNTLDLYNELQDIENDFKNEKNIINGGGDNKIVSFFNWLSNIFYGDENNYDIENENETTSLTWLETVNKYSTK